MIKKILFSEKFGVLHREKLLCSQNIAIFEKSLKEREKEKAVAISVTFSLFLLHLFNSPFINLLQSAENPT